MTQNNYQGGNNQQRNNRNNSGSFNRGGNQQGGYDNQGGNQPAANRGVAHAPYNFVPLPEKVALAVTDAENLPNHNKYYSDGSSDPKSKYHLSGYFDVELTTETPLYVRGMLTEKEAEERAKDKEKHKNKSYFFQVANKPVIPGSSLRGMIRNLTEIVTFSKVQPITDRQLVYRAVGDTTRFGDYYRNQILGRNQSQTRTPLFEYPLANLKGGYLKKSANGWEIQPAKTVNNETFVFVPLADLAKEGISVQGTQITIDPVYVAPVALRQLHTTSGNYPVDIRIAITRQISTTPAIGLEKATIVVSGRAFNRKWHPAIFEKSGTTKAIPIPDAMWQTYVSDRDATRGTTTPTRKLKNDGDALFYLLDDSGNLVFFGPTLMLRLPYLNTIETFNTTENVELDIAEAMFGYVSKKQEGKQGSKDKAYASRVSVTNAHVISEGSNFYESEFTPKNLGGPKPTTFQHYLEQLKGKDTEKKSLLHYGDLNETQIRGHKLYWRQQDVTIVDIRELDQSKVGDDQHTKMQPVKAGVRFKFQVHFDNLSSEELGALAWVLTLPGSDEHRHQLGMGKPYGMGVVKLEAKLKLIDRAKRYQSLLSGENWELGFTTENVPNADSCIETFKEHICEEVGEQVFEEILRIKQLLTMLTLRPKDNKKFAYMQIKGPNGNEFKDRPVLPYPSEVIDGQKVTPVLQRRNAGTQPTTQTAPKQASAGSNFSSQSNRSNSGGYSSPATQAKPVTPPLSEDARKFLGEIQQMSRKEIGSKPGNLWPQQIKIRVKDEKELKVLAEALVKKLKEYEAYDKAVAANKPWIQEVVALTSQPENLESKES